jgi:hypothetical protein
LNARDEIGGCQQPQPPPFAPFRHLALRALWIATFASNTGCGSRTQRIAADQWNGTFRQTWRCTFARQASIGAFIGFERRLHPEGDQHSRYGDDRDRQHNVYVVAPVPAGLGEKPRHHYRCSAWPPPGSCLRFGPRVTATPARLGSGLPATAFAG